MPNDRTIAVLSRLSAPMLGVFRGRVAIENGVTRDQLTRLRATGAIERLHPDVYRMSAVAASAEQRLRAALLWAGESASATGRSAAMLYGLEGVAADVPEIVLPYGVRGRSRDIVVRHGARTAFMTRRVRGIPVTGPEYTREHTILETNGRRWHDDPADYEHDHEKWSVPGRHGYRLVLATWDKVTRTPQALLGDLMATMTP